MSAALTALGSLSEYITHTNFTKVQEQVIPSLINSQQNVIVAAPTGSGKTVLLEVAMLRLFKNRLLPPKNAAAVAESSSGSSHNENDIISARQKAVYICPIKALANEKYELWKEKFPTLSVLIETGDQERERLERDSLTSVSTADIIITTPERWDSITRRWKEKTVMEVVHSVGLLLLDEIHTVHEERGAALEAVVSRMKAIKSALQSSETAATSSTGARFVAISGTLPNIKDFAEWLSVPPQMAFSFSAKDRPVPLSVHVIGYANDSKNPFAFDRFLNFKLFHTIKQYSEGKPTMVFCSSRKEAVTSAQRLVQDIQSAAERDGQASLLQPSAEVEQFASSASDKHLRACLVLGVAFHHAAMTLNDRRLVEQMFKEQYVAVICTTTTLALGVNLPAHLVVIKGTHFFKSGKREDVPLSEMMQMCGRAGRPGLDDHGIAVVLTTENKVRFYQNLRSGDVYSTVESQLHRHMIEHVNAEVALRTIHSFQSALDWVRTTFFWIRLQKAPQNYGLTFKNKADADAFRPEAFIERLMERVLRALEREDCIIVKHVGDRAGDAEDSSEHENDGSALLLHDKNLIETTRIGRSLARLYILFGTVQTFNAFMQKRINAKANEKGSTLLEEEEESKATAVVAEAEEQNEVTGEEKEEDSYNLDTKDDDGDDEDSAAQPPDDKARRSYLLAEVLTLLCHSEEFVDVHLRQGDRGPLNEFNKVVKYPLRGGHKGGREVREDWQKAYVLLQVQLGQLSINDVSLRNDFYRLWSVIPRVARFLVDYAWTTKSFSFALQAVVLLRCIEQHVWEDGLVLRQLDGVGESVARALSRGGFRDFKSVLAADPRKLEVLCSRLPPFGSQLKAQVEAVPRCRMIVKRETPAPAPAGTARCTLFTASTTSVKFTVEVYPDLQNTLGPVYTAEDSKAAAGADEQHEPPSRSKHLKLSKLWSYSSFLLLVGHASCDQIYLQRFIPISALFDKKHVGQAKFTFLLPSGVPCSGTQVHLLTGHFVGSDQSVVLNENGLPCSGGGGGAHTDVGTSGCSRRMDEFMVAKGDQTAKTATTTTTTSTTTAKVTTEKNTGHKKSAKRSREGEREGTESVVSPSSFTKKTSNPETVENGDDAQEEGKPTSCPSSYDQLLRDLQWIETNGRPRSSAVRTQAKDVKTAAAVNRSGTTTTESPADLMTTAVATPLKDCSPLHGAKNGGDDVAQNVTPLAQEEEAASKAAAGLEVSRVSQDEGAAEQPQCEPLRTETPRVAIQLRRWPSPEPKLQPQPQPPVPQQWQYQQQQLLGMVPSYMPVAPFAAENCGPDYNSNSHNYRNELYYGAAPTRACANTHSSMLLEYGSAGGFYTGGHSPASFPVSVGEGAPGVYPSVTPCAAPFNPVPVGQQQGAGGGRFRFNVSTNRTLSHRSVPSYGSARGSSEGGGGAHALRHATASRGEATRTVQRGEQPGVTIHPGRFSSHQSANSVYYSNVPHQYDHPALAPQMQAPAESCADGPQIVYVPVYQPPPFPARELQKTHPFPVSQICNDHSFFPDQSGRAFLANRCHHGDDALWAPTRTEAFSSPSTKPHTTVSPTPFAFNESVASPLAVYGQNGGAKQTSTASQLPPRTSSAMFTGAHGFGGRGTRSRGGNRNSVNQFQPIEPNWW